MHLDELLTTAVLLLGASAVGIALFHRAGFGSVLGLLATGVLLGPHTPGPVVNIQQLAAAAELGVVFLLFVIGLELEPRRLWAMRRALFGLGTLQVAITGLALAGIALAAGRPWPAALILGLGLALSSTAFVLQLLTERGELATEHGRAVFAILLLQDIAVVPLLAMVPLLAAGSAGPEAASVGASLALVTAALGLVVLLGTLVLPRAFTLVARQRSTEAFAVLAALAVPVAAWVTHRAGLSPALGAFLLGVLLSRSPFHHHQVAAEVTPFKGLLLGLFFISVGMSIEFGAFAGRWREVVALVASLILVKGAVIFALCRLFGLGNAAGLRTALLMTQGGEFGFVLFAAAAAAGVVGHQLQATALLVISVSMTATPFLARVGERLARSLPEPPGHAPTGTHDAAVATLERHVVVAGYGRVGRAIGAMLDAADIPFLALDLDVAKVLAARREGRKVLYGDASDPRVLDLAGTGRAAALVVTLDRPGAAERIVATVRSFYPGATIVARAHDGAGSDRLERLGATVVVPETLELSLSIGEAVLQRLCVPDAAAAAAAEVLRRYHRRDLG